MKNDHLTTNKKTYAAIKQFLHDNANAIQKRATQHHKDFIGEEQFRSEMIAKYHNSHINIVEQLASHLEQRNIQNGLPVFKQLGETIALDSISDGLTIQEAVDGVIFLKQALWEKAQEAGLLNQLTTVEFYNISHGVGIYIDVVSSKIAFAYHDYYEKKTAEDLAERQRLEQQRDEFLGMVSHELKTPVTSLKGLVQLIGTKITRSGDEKSERFLKVIDVQINKLAALIDDLRDITIIKEGVLQFHDDFFPFDALVDEIVDTTQLTTEKHAIVKEGRTRKRVYGDRNRIGQVLSNLVTNAIKYSPQSDKVIVKLASDRKTVSCSVQDFGIGIAKDEQSHIFERFYREQGQKGAIVPGLGLGLYIVREIIQRYGGRIVVDSEKGQGSTFTFVYPIGDDKKQHANVQAEDQPSTHERR